MNFVERKGLDEEGIYRLSGDQKEIKKLKKAFEKGKVPDFNVDTDPNSVACVLKLFLKELPQPIFTFELHDSFIACADVCDPKLKEAAIRKVVQLLPAGNKFVLKRLFQHLQLVSSMKDKNKMSAGNLAIVFAPTLMRAAEETLDQMIKQTPKRNEVVERLISDPQLYFEKQNDTQLDNHLKEAEVEWFSTLRNSTIKLVTSLYQESLQTNRQQHTEVHLRTEKEKPHDPFSCISFNTASNEDIPVVIHAEESTLQDPFVTANNVTFSSPPQARGIGESGSAVVGRGKGMVDELNLIYKSRTSLNFRAAVTAASAIQTFAPVPVLKPPQNSPSTPTSGSANNSPRTSPAAVPPRPQARASPPTSPKLPATPPRPTPPALKSVKSVAVNRSKSSTVSLSNSLPLPDLQRLAGAPSPEELPPPPSPSSISLASMSDLPPPPDLPLHPPLPPPPSHIAPSQQKAPSSILPTHQQKAPPSIISPTTTQPKAPPSITPPTIHQPKAPITTSTTYQPKAPPVITTPTHQLKISGGNAPTNQANAILLAQAHPTRPMPHSLPQPPSLSIPKAHNATVAVRSLSPASQGQRLTSTFMACLPPPPPPPPLFFARSFGLTIKKNAPEEEEEEEEQGWENNNSDNGAEVEWDKVDLLVKEVLNNSGGLSITQILQNYA